MILGVDPGGSKFGWAFVSEGLPHEVAAGVSRGELLQSGICRVEERELFGHLCLSRSRSWNDYAPWERERSPCAGRLIVEVETVALGNGTHGAGMSRWLKTLGLSVFSVDESNTTLEARQLYWRLHRPTLWQRCLPFSLRIPSRSLDDLAAWGIALRLLER